MCLESLKSFQMPARASFFKNPQHATFVSIRRRRNCVYVYLIYFPPPPPPLGFSTTVRELGSRVPAPLPPPFFPRLRGLPWSGVLSSPAAPAIEEGEQKELACWVRWMDVGDLGEREVCGLVWHGWERMEGGGGGEALQLSTSHWCHRGEEDEKRIFPGRNFGML